MVKGLKNYLLTLSPPGDSIDFTLSNARQFYSSKGDPLYVNDLTSILLLFLGETGERSTTTPSSQKQWGSLFPSFGVLGIVAGLYFKGARRKPGRFQNLRPVSITKSVIEP